MREKRCPGVFDRKVACAMAEWVQLVNAEPCGRCGVLQPVGTMVRAYEGRLRTESRRIRCPRCLEGMVPPSLIPERLVSRAMTAKEMETRMAHIGDVAKQFARPERPKPTLVPRKRAYRGDPEPDRKQRQAGDLLDKLPRTW